MNDNRTSNPNAETWDECVRLRTEVADLKRQLAKEESAHRNTMHERDRATEFADDLANDIEAYTGEEVGEHSNLNCPWEAAHEIMRARIAKRTADEPSAGRTGVGSYCTVGPASEQVMKFMLIFEDRDRGMCIYTDEAEARREFARAEGNGWNCHLFGLLSRASEPPDAVLTEAERLLQAWASPLPPNGTLYWVHVERAREYFKGRCDLCKGTGSSILNNSFVPCPNCTAVTKSAAPELDAMHDALRAADRIANETSDCPHVGCTIAGKHTHQSGGPQQP